MPANNIHMQMRKYHRMLGFFLAGIMAVYAISGVALIFRKSNLLKVEQRELQMISPQLSAEQLVQDYELTLVEIDTELLRTESDGTIKIEKSGVPGTYDMQSGALTTTDWAYPFVLDKLINLHKATTNSPLYYLNILFGVSLLLFTISAFFMFMPKTPIFTSTLKIAGAGFVFALVVVIFGS